MPDVDVSVAAVMSAPRYGNHISRGSVEKSLEELSIPLQVYTGVFWHHVLTDLFMEAVYTHDCEWILCFDHDTILAPEHVINLLTHAVKHDLDALAALQPKRASDDPLFSMISGKFDESILQVQTAHFGCTAIKCDALKDVPHPWFWEVPDRDGMWAKRAHTGEVHPIVATLHDSFANFVTCDADIWFWHNWKWSNKKVYVDCSVRVGHMEELVSYYSGPGKIERVTYGDWMKIQQQAQNASDNDRPEEVAREAGHNGHQGGGSAGDAGPAEKPSETEPQPARYPC